MKSFGSKPSGVRLERMQASPLWTGERFANRHPIMPGLRDTSAPMPTLTQFICGGQRRVPRSPLPSMNPLEQWAKSAASGLRATWLGHATVLIEIEGLRVLTDPVWGPRASPSRLIGPKRFQPVPVPLHALPPIDLVLVSHDHYDHLDYPTIRQLAKLNLPFVTSLGVGAHLEAWVFDRRTSSSSIGGNRIACPAPSSRSRRLPRSTSRAGPSRAGTRRSGPRSSFARPATACSSAATRASRLNIRPSVSGSDPSTW